MENLRLTRALTPSKIEIDAELQLGKKIVQLSTEVASFQEIYPDAPPEIHEACRTIQSEAARIVEWHLGLLGDLLVVPE